MASSVLGLRVVPEEVVKCITLVRHAQAESNVAGMVTRDAYRSEEWFDARITELGREQARGLNARLGAAGTMDRFEVVLTSPLSRALQTMEVAFEGCSAKRVAVEGCRERLGVNPCDRRRSLAELRERFPGVDFDEAMGECSEHDALWEGYGKERREPKEHLEARFVAFLRYLLSRPEREIAVVTHSSFLFFGLALFAGSETDSPEVTDGVRRWFENCESRRLYLSDSMLAPESLAIKPPTEEATKALAAQAEREAGRRP